MTVLARVPQTLRWQNDVLTILDQRALPHSEEELALTTVEEVHDAIIHLAVRGAPAIGIAAAYGMLLGLKELPPHELQDVLQARGRYLVAARPTAVNLSWSISRLLGVAKTSADHELIDNLHKEAKSIHEEDRQACRKIGEYGQSLLHDGINILTHCNAGSLAVSELGTALAPIYCAKDSGIKVHVYVDETRPLLQGARLTTYELSRADIPCTLITDNMAAHLMSLGDIDIVIVGADRVAANGDVANKVGTLNLAILCQYFSIPFYVACPTSTIDAGTACGADIEIEHRDPVEVTHLAGIRIAPEHTRASNPAFDVTPAALISGIVTEQGIIDPGAISA